nr:hypothetical protein [Tanacetum cinerariifolium]
GGGGGVAVVVGFGVVAEVLGEGVQVLGRGVDADGLQAGFGGPLIGDVVAQGHVAEAQKRGIVQEIIAELRA